MSETPVMTSSISPSGVQDANRLILVNAGYAKWTDASRNLIEIDFAKILADLVQVTKIKAK